MDIAAVLGLALAALAFGAQFLSGRSKAVDAIRAERNDERARSDRLKAERDEALVALEKRNRQTDVTQLQELLHEQDERQERILSTLEAHSLMLEALLDLASAVDPIRSALFRTEQARRLLGDR